MTDINELKCFDCDLGYDDCECGTDSEEYPGDAADAAYEEHWNEEDNYSDAEADADTLASAGYGTDEDYMNGELGDGFFDYGPGEG